MESCPIAITGVSCRFAQSPDPGAFWRLVMERKSAITPLGEDLLLPPWGGSLFPGRAYPTAGGQLGDLYSCVPDDVSPGAAIVEGENQDLHFAVQLALDALADSGASMRALHQQRGTVRFGYAPPFSSSTVNWLQHTLFLDQTMEVISRNVRNAPGGALEEIRRKLAESLPPPDAGSFLSGSGNRIAARIAARCMFTGGAATIDSGALSGIAAISAAADDLRSGRADVALAGALTPPLSRPLLEGLSGEAVFSKGADFTPFSRDSDGLVPGEGGAFFVLKREADALQARDRIYALVKSAACGTAPADELMAAAAERAGAGLQSVQLIEGDSSGEPDKDAEEVAAIRRCWGDHRPGAALVGLGSVKGNVGHCFRAGSAAAVLKAALALRRKVLPPQTPAERPLALLEDASSPVYVLNEARPWITGDPSSPRRALVMASDFGGRRAALLMEEEPAMEDRA